MQPPRRGKIKRFGARGKIDDRRRDGVRARRLFGGPEQRRRIRREDGEGVLHSDAAGGQSLRMERAFASGPVIGSKKGERSVRLLHSRGGETKRESKSGRTITDFSRAHLIERAGNEQRQEAASLFFRG